MEVKMEFSVKNTAYNCHFLYIILFISFIRFQHTYFYFKRCKNDQDICHVLCQQIAKSILLA